MDWLHWHGSTCGTYHDRCFINKGENGARHYAGWFSYYRLIILNDTRLHVVAMVTLPSHVFPPSRCFLPKAAPRVATTAFSDKSCRVKRLSVSVAFEHGPFPAPRSTKIHRQIIARLPVWDLAHENRTQKNPDAMLWLLEHHLKPFPPIDCLSITSL